MSSFSNPHYMYLFDMKNGRKKLAYGRSPEDALEILRSRLTDAEMQEVLSDQHIKTHQRKLAEYVNLLSERAPHRKPVMNSPESSIIIPVFNRADLTSECLEALRGTVDMRTHELIVVDNASTDDTPALLETHPLSPRLIRNDQNLGFARACNQGAETARGEFLLFLNNDTAPTPNWLEPLVEILRGDPGVAAVGCRLLYPDSQLIQHAGVAFDSPAPYHLWCGFPADWPPANEQQEVDAVTAACMLVRRSAFLDLGGFDESYMNGFEDVDFCLRLREKGHRIVYCPTSVVLHHESMTEGRWLQEERNFDLFCERWAERLRGRGTARRELIVAALDEVFRINSSGSRFVGIRDRRLFRHDASPPTVRVFRYRVPLELTAMWLRLRYFSRWRRVRRIKAALTRSRALRR